MSSLILIKYIFIGCMFIHLWTKTDFFAYYCKLLSRFIPKTIYSWLLISEYFNRPIEEYIYDSYIEYLFAKRSFSKSFIVNFLLKMISCTLCLSVWVSIAISVIYMDILVLGIVFVALRALDFLLNYFLKNS